MSTTPERLDIRSKELKALFDYWHAKRGDRLVPSRSDIIPTEIKPLLPKIFMIDIVGMPRRFRFRLAGTSVVDRYGEEITGRFLDELDMQNFNREIAKDYHQAAESRRPTCSRWNYTKRDGKLLRYERLLLPLSSDGTTVDILLGAAAEELFSSSATT